MPLQVLLSPCIRRSSLVLIALFQSVCVAPELLHHIVNPAIPRAKV